MPTLGTSKSSSDSYVGLHYFSVPAWNTGVSRNSRFFVAITKTDMLFFCFSRRVGLSRCSADELHLIQRVFEDKVVGRSRNRVDGYTNGLRSVA